MMKEEFSALVLEIMQHGFDQKTASHYAALIGDTPVVDADGNVLVIEGEIILARIKLQFFALE